MRDAGKEVGGGAGSGIGCRAVCSAAEAGGASGCRCWGAAVAWPGVDRSTGRRTASSSWPIVWLLLCGNAWRTGWPDFARSDWLRRHPSPAPPLSQAVNNVAQTFGAVAPVHAHRQFGSIGVALLQCLENAFVLLHRLPQLFDDGAGIEPPVAFRLRLDGIVQRQQARAGRGFHHPAMKAHVHIED